MRKTRPEWRNWMIKNHQEGCSCKMRCVRLERQIQKAEGGDGAVDASGPPEEDIMGI